MKPTNLLQVKKMSSSSGFKSQAQRGNALKKVLEGKMTQEQFDAYDKQTEKTSLPKKVPYSPKGLVRGPRKTR